MRKIDVHYTLLLDYYGKLLPQKQYDIANLYYNDDLSLSEIAEQLGITRQGVRDGLERAESGLDKFEAALGLIERDKVTADAVDTITKSVAKLRTGSDAEALDAIEKACGTLALKG